MPTETNGQKAGIIIILLLIEHAVYHLCQCRAHLPVGQFLRQFLIPSHKGQWLHGCQTVRNTATYHGKRSLRRDETLKNYGKLLRTFQSTVIILTVVKTGVCLCVYHILQGLQIHWMKHITGIIVECKNRTVSIPSVAHIPFFHLAYRGHHTVVIIIPSAGGLSQKALDCARKKEPVGIRRFYRT